MYQMKTKILKKIDTEMCKFMLSSVIGAVVTVSGESEFDFKEGGVGGLPEI